MKICVALLVIAFTACAEKATVAPAAEQTKPAERAAPAAEQTKPAERAAPAAEQTKPAERAPPPDRPSTARLRAVTRIMVKQYAFEAYPQWAASHPDRMCPDKLADLTEFMNGGDGNDAWGRPLTMMCGAMLPPGAKGLAVSSKGEDGKDGTADDIKSWE